MLLLFLSSSKLISTLTNCKFLDDGGLPIIGYADFFFVLLNWIFSLMRSLLLLCNFLFSFHVYWRPTPPSAARASEQELWEVADRPWQWLGAFPAERSADQVSSSAPLFLFPKSPEHYSLFLQRRVRICYFFFRNLA